MSVLAALTPPLLVCAVVIAAIVGFLRHEMGRARRHPGAGSADNSEDVPTATDEVDYGRGGDIGAGASGLRDS